MSKKLLFLIMLLSISVFSKEYELEFNNQKINVKLDEPIVLKLNDKESINLKFKEKEEQTFTSDNKYTFKYKKDNPPIVKKLSKDLTQIVMVNDNSNQIIIQEYNFKIDKNLIYENILSTVNKENNDVKHLQTLVSKEKKGKMILGDSFFIDDNGITTKYVFYYKEFKDNVIVIIDTTTFKEKEPDEKSKGLNYNLFWRTLDFN